MAEIVVDPADPLQKVRIVAGEADQAESVLQEGLADHVHEGSEVAGISPVVLVGDDERAGGRQAAMQFDDSRAIGVSEVVGLEYDVVPLGDDGTTGAFEKRVVVRSENVGPREIEQGFVEWQGFMLQVRDGVPKHLVESGPAKGCLDVVRQRRNLKVPLVGFRRVAVETLVEAIAQPGPVGESRVRSGRCGVLAEAGSDHDGDQTEAKKGDVVELLEITFPVSYS